MTPLVGVLSVYISIPLTGRLIFIRVYIHIYNTWPIDVTCIAPNYPLGVIRVLKYSPRKYERTSGASKTMASWTIPHGLGWEESTHALNKKAREQVKGRISGQRYIYGLRSGQTCGMLYIPYITIYIFNFLIYFYYIL